MTAGKAPPDHEVRPPARVGSGGREDKQQRAAGGRSAFSLDDPTHKPHEPRRIQLLRRKGWRKPPGAIVVTRISKHWGNPYLVDEYGRDEAIRLFRRYLANNPDLVAHARTELAGRDLACVCRLDEPCHADVWLEIVNGEGGVTPCG